jgi:hypothetical protein
MWTIHNDEILIQFVKHRNDDDALPNDEWNKLMILAWG